MKEIKREVTKEQIVYELTKEELEAIKGAARNSGRDDVVGYLSFVIKNYRYELNLAGATNLVAEVIDFLSGERNSIGNIYGYSFVEYIKKYR